MTSVPYIELHCHSNFSFLDGASDPEALVDRAVELGYPALAITDTNGLYGIVRFDQQARRAGLRPIFGAAALLDTGHRLVLLVKDGAGYANLSELLSTAQLESPKGEARVSRALLERHADGLIALVHDDLAACLLREEHSEAERLLADYRDLYGRDHVYVELRHHNLPVHEHLCAALVRLGRRLGLPAVAANDVHYAAPDGRRLQDVLTCIRHHTTLDEAGELLYPNAERCLQPPAVMARRFARYPEAAAHTLAIAERCWFSLEQLETSLPDFPVPAGHTEQSYLEELTWAGARRRYPEMAEPHVRQLRHELRIIDRLKLAGYFLIVWDIARFCAERAILCQGRGSAANSAVCYCLGITAVDPIKLDLLFERFISEERREPPDIDIDIANNRREEVIQYVYAKYGRTHAAMVCEVISYRGRSAVRDIGKTLGFSPDEVTRLSKLLDHWASPEDVAERLREAALNLGDRRVRLLLDLCRQIHRFPRHLGIHVGGMIITRKPLSQVVPIENATMPDRSVIQWDKDDVGAAGLVKIDLLGLGMLTLIDLALKLVKEHRGVTIDPARLSYDDPKVFDLLCRAETLGVFQVESRAQMNALPRHRPRCFYDLVIEVALIRPGPIQGDMVHPYLRRRNGEEPVTYPHPCLEPILRRTLGVPLFQEQGMKVAVAAAGFTASQADELRRAMGHKRSRERMAALAERLIDGMQRHGIPHDAARRIFDQLAAFADFGFAESHAASFALLVYVSAYLKVYYPQEFYCSLLNAQPMGFYAPSSIVYEARRRGVMILPVDVSRSRFDSTVEGDAVRLGLRTVRHIGETARATIESEQARGPFTSLKDFVRRSRLGPQPLAQLARVGAFDCFGYHRRQALWIVLGLSRRAGELDLAVEETGHTTLRPMHIGEQIVADFKGMDLSTGPHPMALIRDQLAACKILAAADLRHRRDKSRVAVAGVVVIRQRPVTAKGFLFLTMEDETGFINVVVMPSMLARHRRTIVHHQALIVQGILERQDGVINVIGRQFAPLEAAPGDVTFRSRDFR
ncbi:MAG TPA: error-prone DNA polymerase [candidate division Zixibacteria bacterium]|nr:error-prone DNA polymerase [candidate division Zixibacteria bacterium]MDD4918846.1 error-prone DNA polymerase [candidate division Zixibacteria bacterium]MDM7974337.1 error-prone DNA polymerase [candidate division Zixibacteria bacterium]HOZ07016.1 error-prone DNA polymerase [candidate division Zixibacteria bacterium]HPM35970.1 error-prone DNA polymerase [candidate division Zixibacteria bacterium]